MTDATSNDNEFARPDNALRGPDAHGQAAMLLVESLIHGLVDRSVISVEDAVEIVGIAIEVKEDIAVEMGDSQATMMKSLSLLGAIGDSLSHDLKQTGRGGPKPDGSGKRSD